MRIFWDPRQLAHAPSIEMHNGRIEPCSETPARAQAILGAVGTTELPRDHGEAPILRVHPRPYVDFLRSAHDDWLAAGRTGDALPYAFPAVRRRDLRVDRIDARLGRYAYDTCTPIAEGTWTSAYWNAQTALSGLEALEAERTAFALCRPPGHHCGADYMGGYCYLNSAAIAAEAALAAGRKRVAILDIDYHHGKGTQDIFYARGDVFFASIHADPATDYPFDWGHSDETGEGDGAGATLNLPLPRGTRLAAFERALGRYSYDTCTPIAEGTWTSAYWNAQAALSALEALAAERTAFALCRPPGHHCGADYMGGYCYLNSAAIAAEAAIAAGRSRVAILDIDYHHGNGTQDIFYARGDVLFASIHADPATDYPFYWGHSDETGQGEGGGATLNLPLPRGTRLAEFERALDQALDRIAAFGPELLIVSYGADTYAGDPISHFAIETGDYPAIARRIASLALPTLIEMEGGYAVDALGANVAEFLGRF